MYNVENLVKNEILKCESGLIELLLKVGCENSEINQAGYSIDMVENSYKKNEDTQNRIDELEELEDITEEQEEELEELKDEEEECQEIFEWWSVTKWLYEKLLENGEPCLYADFGYYWGRTTTGQAINMDSVISKIAE